MMMFIILLCMIGIIVVGGYFGFKQLRKSQETMKVLHHRQSQSVSLGDVDSRVEARVEAAVSNAMSMERRRLEEMYQTAMEHVVEAEALATQRAEALARPVKRKRNAKRGDRDQEEKEQKKADAIEPETSDASSTYELRAESIKEKKRTKKAKKFETVVDSTR